MVDRVSLLRNAHDLPILITQKPPEIYRQSALKQRDDLFAKSDAIELVRSESGQQMAANVLNEIQTFIGLIEAERKTLLAPLLDFQRTVNAHLQLLIKPLEEEKARLKGLISVHFVQQQDEARRKQAIQDELVAKLAQERAALAEEIPTAKTEAAQEALSKEMGALLIPVEVAKAKGIAATPTIKFEVTDVHALYQARRDLVDLEPKRAEINKVIRYPGNIGIQIPGLRIYTEMEVRPA